MDQVSVQLNPNSFKEFVDFQTQFCYMILKLTHFMIIINHHIIAPGAYARMGTPRLISQNT